MKKKIWLIIGAVCALLALAAAIFIANRPTPKDKMMAMLDRAEQALGDQWKKQSVTEVYDLVYSNNKGRTILYHICITSYYEAEPSDQTGLNTEAISAVISPEEAESCRECTVSGLPAAIYQKDGRAYLCWTVLPELSCVIEYDPTTEREEDMLRMAESVPANQSQTGNP